ncbi:hypothetical protein M758_1G314100 [Ceratodon purpureus]|nr:hypothetical protein M758_1G314100 [Ceratodon purpureus]
MCWTSHCGTGAIHDLFCFVSAWHSCYEGTPTQNFCSSKQAFMCATTEDSTT